jgi:hypothetical protein
MDTIAADRRDFNVLYSPPTNLTEVWKYKLTFPRRCFTRGAISYLLLHFAGVQNYWVCGLCPLAGILKTREHDVSETGCVSVLR